MGIQDVLRKLRAHGDAQQAERHIEDGGKALGGVQDMVAESVNSHLIAVAHIDQRHQRDHQNAALEAAAGRQVAVKDDVEHVDDADGQDLVSAAAGDHVLDDGFFIHLYRPPFRLSS